MAQIPINPTDNDRLKTRKVQQMLDDLGVLPADHSLRPTFLRSRRAASVLIDRALDGLALDPSARKHCCKNSEDFVAAINSKFMTAFNAGGGGDAGDWPLVLDFENGSYTSATATYALADVWVPDTDFGSGGDLANVQPGVGFAYSGLGSQDFHFADDVFAQLISAGPIVVLDFTTDGNPTSGVAGILYETTNFTSNDFQIGNGGVNFLRDKNNAHFVSLPQLTNGAHKMAMRFHADRYAISIDGGAVITLDNPVQGDFPFDRLLISLQNASGTTVLRSATFRDPAEGEAALPALSGG